VDSAESLRVYLELVGHQVTVAHSGPEGIKAAGAGAPEVILSDIGLPGMNGYAVCEQLRKDPAFTTTLFIALSGHGSGGNREQALGAGFDLYLVKPVNPEELSRILAGDTPRTDEHG
jgi:two-component system CheB/CheR fusion protein